MTRNMALVAAIALATLLSACGDKSLGTVTPSSSLANDVQSGGAPALHPAMARTLRSVRPDDEFRGEYAGTYTGTTCVDNPKRSGFLYFNGAGTASFLHASSEVIELHQPWRLRCGDIHGVAKLTSSDDPQDYLYMRLIESRTSERLCYSLGWEVHGHGKFSRAMGRGELRISCSGGNTYSDQWLGTITF